MTWFPRLFPNTVVRLANLLSTMHPFIVLLSILPFVAPSSQYNIQKLFGPSLSPGAEILLRSDASWTQAVQQRWSKWEEPNYKGAIKVATVGDVQNVVCNATLHQQDCRKLFTHDRSKLQPRMTSSSLQLLLAMVPRKPTVACVMGSTSILAI